MIQLDRDWSSAPAVLAHKVVQLTSRGQEALQCLGCELHMWFVRNEN